MKCNCPMYRNCGTCYHTGYRPRFSKPLVARIAEAADRVIPRIVDKRRKEQKLRWRVTPYKEPQE